MPRVCFKIIPAPVGLGFASVLGPTHGWVANVGCSLPLFCSGGTSPRPLGRGLRPLHPPSPPSLAEDSPAFWVPLVGGLQGLVTRPFLSFRGGTPPRPPPGLRPLDPRLPTLVGLGFASVLGLNSPRPLSEAEQIFPLPSQGESAEKVVRILKLWYDLPTLSLSGGGCNVGRKLLSAIY